MKKLSILLSVFFIVGSIVFIPTLLGNIVRDSLIFAKSNQYQKFTCKIVGFDSTKRSWPNRYFSYVYAVTEEGERIKIAMSDYKNPEIGVIADAWILKNSSNFSVSGKPTTVVGGDYFNKISLFRIVLFLVILLAHGTVVIFSAKRIVSINSPTRINPVA